MGFVYLHSESWLQSECTRYDSEQSRKDSGSLPGTLGCLCTCAHTHTPHTNAHPTYTCAHMTQYPHVHAPNIQYTQKHTHTHAYTHKTPPYMCAHTHTQPALEKKDCSSLLGKMLKVGRVDNAKSTSFSGSPSIAFRRSPVANLSLFSRLFANNDHLASPQPPACTDRRASTPTKRV